MGALSPMGRMLAQPGHSDLAAYYTGTKEVHAKASLLNPPLTLIRHASQELAARVSHLCTGGGGRWGPTKGRQTPRPLARTAAPHKEKLV